MERFGVILQSFSLWEFYTMQGCLKKQVLANPFGIFPMRQFMMNIPADLGDAARIDRCSQFGIFADIVLPLCISAIAVLFVFYVTQQWDNLIWPLIVIGSESKYTIPTCIYLLIWQKRSLTRVMMAGAVIAMLPMTGLFLVLQNRMVKGISLTGSKF